MLMQQCILRICFKVFCVAVTRCYVQLKPGILRCHRKAFCTCDVGDSVLRPQGILCAGVPATRYSSTGPSLPALQCMLIRSFMVCCTADTRYSAPVPQINLHCIRKVFYAAVTSYSVLEPQVILRQGILHHCCKVFFACDVRHSRLHL